METEALAVGQTFERTFLASDDKVRAFADVSEDRNPVHLDEEAGAKSLFKGRIAHGMLLGAFISATLGENLPGPGSIYLAQTLEFTHPVRIGDTVTVRVEVLSLERSRAVIQTQAFVGAQMVCKGEATVVPPRRRKAVEA